MRCRAFQDLSSVAGCRRRPRYCPEERQPGRTAIVAPATSAMGRRQDMPNEVSSKDGMSPCSKGMRLECSRSDFDKCRHDKRFGDTYLDFVSGITSVQDGE